MKTALLSATLLTALSGLAHAAEPVPSQLRCQGTIAAICEAEVCQPRAAFPILMRYTFDLDAGTWRNDNETGTFSAPAETSQSALRSSARFSYETGGTVMHTAITRERDWLGFSVSARMEDESVIIVLGECTAG